MNTTDHPLKLEPAILVIFGITGDLAARYLLPALYHLIKDGLLPEQTEIIGVSRREVSTDELLKHVELCVLEAEKVCDPAILKQFQQKFRMIRLDPVKAEDYDMLLRTLNDIEDEHGVCMNRLYYLSIPPQVYEPVVENFGRHGLQKGCQHHRAVSRLLVEKPFGYDLTSAEDLIKNTERYFKEDQVFRIDHYLAKETVQNILIFREQNPAFASIWNNQYISQIDISALEQIGVEGRAFYDNVGALRDFVQNHLLQLLAVTTMELPPKSHDSNALHAAKRELLESVHLPDAEHANVVRGQYAGYREEVHNPRSTTETFVGLTLAIDNDRWRDIPIRLTQGKALKIRKSTIAITFAAAPAHTANTLTFRLQPHEGIDIELTVKRPGFEDRTETVQMDFSYRGAMGGAEHPTAYERVLIDAVKGDHSLFATSNEVLASWRILQPILTAWEQGSDDLLFYQPGSNGPTAEIAPPHSKR